MKDTQWTIFLVFKLSLFMHLSSRSQELIPLVAHQYTCDSHIFQNPFRRPLMLPEFSPACDDQEQYYLEVSGPFDVLCSNEPHRALWVEVGKTWQPEFCSFIVYSTVSLICRQPLESSNWLSGTALGPACWPHGLHIHKKIHKPSVHKIMTILVEIQTMSHARRYRCLKMVDL